MKVIWHSNAPWVPSGYGKQTALAAPRIKAAGHDVLISGFAGSIPTSAEWNGISVLPAARDSFGNDVLGVYADRFFGKLSDGWVLTLMDLQWFGPIEGMRVASWVPVDHSPVPPPVCEKLTTFDIAPIAMSRYGQQELQAAGFDARFVPHGIDLDVFKPYNPREARMLWDISEDAFVVGIVASNRYSTVRKGLSEAIHAFAEFRKIASNAVLLIHAEGGPAWGGADLTHLVQMLGIEDSVRFRDPFGFQVGVSDRVMAVTYAAMNVLLNTSYGEGFGLPIVEAQACGVPVIATNFSAMPENVHVGWLVDGEPYYDGQKACFLRPSISSIVDALEEAYTKARFMRDAAVRDARRYEVDYVFETYWRPVLAEMEAGVG